MVAGSAPGARAADGLQGDVDQAVAILGKFKDIPEKSIPRDVLRDAHGLAILTVFKAGFIASGSGGKGLVVSRVGKSWSGPSAIGTGGAGFGFQVGVEVTEFVLVLNTPEAVKAFSRQGNVTLGADVSVAVGPLGRTASAGVTPVAAVYTYSRSQGLFGGVSLEGAVIATRDDANTAYYGRAVTPEQILSGEVKPPKGARKLVAALSKY
jgi:lipid-binding SYLF domain-containing protein